MALSAKFSPLLAGVVLLGGFLVYVSLPEQAAVENKQSLPTPVSVATVEERAFPITIEALGTAKANESVTITAQQTEVVASINFDDGDKVNAGAVLVQLDNSEEVARVRELEATIDEARRQYERIQNLARTNATSQQLLDEQQARVQVLEAQLDVARARLDDLEIRAPFSGNLGIRGVSKGALIQPSDVITTLDDTSVVKVDFSVAETHLSSLAPGQLVRAFSVAYPNETFTGEITTVDSRVDPVSRSVLVRATIDNADAKLRPGMLLQVTLEKRVLQALVIPEKALVPVQDKQFVFVVNDNQVTQREINIGARRPGVVQIISGLQAGDKVVTEGTLRVRDNSSVRVLNAPSGE